MKLKKQTAGCVAALGAIVLSSPLPAHEFWIDTHVSRAKEDASVSADIRVGQDLSGVALAYLDDTVKSMTHHAPEASIPLAARLGDQPVIKALMPKADGLHIITVETHPAYVSFDTMDEFEEYLGYEGLFDIAAGHIQRRLPMVDITEEYIRNARALVQVGAPDADDIDRATGMPFEIIIQGTPFSSEKRTLGVRLEWRGAPLSNAQISLFHLPIGGSAPHDTTRTLLRTDSAGRAAFPMFGAGKYLLNAVRMDPAEGPDAAFWRSHWASLAFDIPPTHQRVD